MRSVFARGAVPKFDVANEKRCQQACEEEREEKREAEHKEDSEAER